MIKFSLYDFDRTIYSKDTGVEILKYLLKNPKSWIFIPYIAIYCFGYIIKLVSKNRLKEVVFSPISQLKINQWEQFINSFWQKEQKHLFPNVINQIIQDKKDGYTIVILSASAEIFLQSIQQLIPVDFIIGTKLQQTDSHITGKLQGENCKNAEKVVRLIEYINSSYPQTAYEITKMYSDSLHDLPLFRIAKSSFTVEPNGTIRQGLPTPNKNL